MTRSTPTLIPLRPASATLLWTLCAALASSASAADTDYMRIERVEGERISLELASRTFVRPEGGPELCLVGVAHVGDEELYATLEEWLAAYDVVLYESVLPAGARGARGADDAERAESTRVALSFVASFAEAHHELHQRYPADLAELVATARAMDGRFAPWVERAASDAWGRAARYRVSEDGSGFSLWSGGADGQQGGEGVDADILVSEGDGVAAAEVASEGGMQEGLAEALGLSFQLQAMAGSYAQPNWVCSDMAIDEVDRELSRRGQDFGMLKQSLSGEGAQGQMMQTMVDMIPRFDRMMGGGIIDTFKVLIIEMLGDGELVGDAIEMQLGDEFAEVIVRLRNQVVVEDLAALLADDQQPESVAVFYGAAHMGDLEERITQELGYQRVREHWLPAISVDLQESKVNQGVLQMMRGSLQGALRQGR